MKSTLFASLLLASAVLLAGCSGDEKAKSAAPGTPPPPPVVTDAPTSPAAHRRSVQRMDSLEKLVRAAVKTTPERAPSIQLAMYSIQAYQYFAHDFPQDPRAPDALDRAGQLYAGVLRDPAKAVEYYEKAYQQYPNYPKRAMLLVQQGAAYEMAGDTSGAIAAYRRLVLTYPKSKFAGQARDLIRLAQMTPAEQARMLESGGAGAHR